VMVVHHSRGAEARAGKRLGTMRNRVGLAGVRNIRFALRRLGRATQTHEIGRWEVGHSLGSPHTPCSARYHRAGRPP
jgi:hypothetical protein